ncbi:hypothetical protein GIS00_22910 [Nakamurella sp. YIM 132087]|uniref:Uncharacterized protein n=1 Tax=Nakamurella alba TaxID=2665158 RepID=A0A7K1FRL4_9ACTN|nr:hypothetical protein [Nakamurella alba]MTD16787.1 hypothetical protein [Nakamurella alba]
MSGAWADYGRERSGAYSAPGAPTTVRPVVPEPPARAHPDWAPAQAWSAPPSTHWSPAVAPAPHPTRMFERPAGHWPDPLPYRGAPLPTLPPPPIAPPIAPPNGRPGRSGGRSPAVVWLSALVLAALAVTATVILLSTRDSTGTAAPGGPVTAGIPATTGTAPSTAGTAPSTAAPSTSSSGPRQFPPMTGTSNPDGGGTGGGSGGGSVSDPPDPVTSPQTDPETTPSSEGDPYVPPIGPDGGSGSGDPEELATAAAESWVAALNDGDADAAADLTCASLRSAVDEEFVDALEPGSLTIEDITVDPDSTATEGSGELRIGYQRVGDDPQEDTLDLVIEQRAWVICD